MWYLTVVPRHGASGSRASSARERCTLNFAYLHLAGFAVLTAAALASGWDGLPVLMAVVASLPLAVLQRRVTRMARDDRDARDAHALLIALQLAVALILAWTLPTAGTVMFAAGGLLNTTVILANGLRMPVTGSVGHPCYVEIGPSTRFRWLGDIFAARRTANSEWMFSVGDILEMLGLWAVATHLIVTLIP